ncbi:MAG: KilA-N domain-containing protein [Xenococcus sp. (in: cyanobacteria)]
MKQIKHQIGELEVLQRINDGYINATQLCKAYFKLTGRKREPREWFETDRANRFIELVSDQTGISPFDLYRVKKGGRDAGTWIHPDLAVAFASWLSPEFELKVSRWVQEWMATGKNPINPEPIVETSIVPIEPSLEEINLVFSGLNRLKINPGLIESAKLTAISRSIPRLSAVAEEGKRLISSYMVLEELAISPTRLGELIVEKHGLPSVISPQKINQALEQVGLQRRKEQKVIGKKKPKYIWELTQMGQDFGQLQMDTAKTHLKTVVCIRWFTSVIPLIESLFV